MLLSIADFDHSTTKMFVHALTLESDNGIPKLQVTRYTTYTSSIGNAKYRYS